MTTPLWLRCARDWFPFEAAGFLQSGKRSRRRQTSVGGAVERLEDRTLLAVMTDGPLVGGVTHESAKIFARTDESAFVAVEYSTSESFQSSATTPAELTSSTDDFTRIITLSGLQPETKYFYRILVDGQPQQTGRYPSFRTFAVPGSGTDFEFALLADLNDLTRVAPVPTAAAPVYARVAEETPEFVLQIGDFDHRDPQDLESMRLMHREVRGPATPAGQDFATEIASQFPVFHVWDDHDYGTNDGNKEFAGRADALQAFQEYYPTPELANPQAGIWHSFTYGQAEFFMLDLRSQRDPNNQPDDANKSMLDGNNIPDGQKEWLKNGLATSTARWKFVVTTVTMNPTSRLTSKDPWHSFQTERDELLDFIREANISGIVLLSADIHTGGGIDDGTTTFLPEMTVAHTNRTKANVNNMGTWSEGIATGRASGGPGYSLVKIRDNADRVILEAKGEDGEIRAMMMLLADDVTGDVVTGFDAESGLLSVVARVGTEIVIGAAGGNVEVWVDGILDTSLGNVPAADVRSIFVQGSAFDDLIDLSAVSVANGLSSLRGVSIQGSGGDDLIVGSDGTGSFGQIVDLIIGGSGNDTISGGAGDDTILGADGNDELAGNDGSDSLRGDAGDDRLNGGAGNDLLQTDKGEDSLNGEAGRDTLVVDSFTINSAPLPGLTLDGGGDDDQLVVNATSRKDLITIGQTANGDAVVDVNGNILTAAGTELVVVNADNADDQVDASAAPVSVELNGEEGRDTLIGGGTDDTLTGGPGPDLIEGGDGADRIDGGADADVLKGQRGEDTLDGGDGNDTLYGGGHRDLLVGNNGNDRLNGNAGDDLLKGERGRDTLIGNAGDDTLSGGPHDDLLNGKAGDDKLLGNHGDDVLHGDIGHDLVRGGDGNDLLNGGVGNDTLKGGNGNDGLSGWLGDDSLAGGGENDTLVGGEGSDTLLGGDGEDTLLGGEGNDFVKGQQGIDVVAGGGNGAPPGPADTIKGPDSEVDELFTFDPPLDWIDAV